MSHWNYRVVRRVFSEGEEYEEVTFAVHEAYYDSKGGVESITKDSVAPYYNETVDEGSSLREAFETQMKAFALPTLNYEDY